MKRNLLAKDIEQLESTSLATAFGAAVPDVVDASLLCGDCTACSECTGCTGCTACSECTGCTSCSLCSDCTGCTNCTCGVVASLCCVACSQGTVNTAGDLKDVQFTFVIGPEEDSQ